MTSGIEIYGADGSLQIGVDSRLLRTLTSVVTGTSDGSVSVPGAVQGTVVGVATNVPSDGVTSQVTSSGTTVSWSFSSAPASDRRSVQLNISVY